MPNLGELRPGAYRPDEEIMPSPDASFRERFGGFDPIGAEIFRRGTPALGEYDVSPARQRDRQYATFARAPAGDLRTLDQYAAMLFSPQVSPGAAGHFRRNAFDDIEAVKPISTGSMFFGPRMTAEDMSFTRKPGAFLTRSTAGKVADPSQKFMKHKGEAPDFKAEDRASMLAPNEDLFPPEQYAPPRFSKEWFERVAAQTMRGAGQTGADLADIFGRTLTLPEEKFNYRTPDYLVPSEKKTKAFYKTMGNFLGFTPEMQRKLEVEAPKGSDEALAFAAGGFLPFGGLARLTRKGALGAAAYRGYTLDDFLPSQ